MRVYEALNVLSLQMPFTQEQLKQSYKNAARKAHPDAGGTREGAILVNAAYETLGSYVGHASSGCLDNLPQTAADFDRWWSDFQKERFFSPCCLEFAKGAQNSERSKIKSCGHYDFKLPIGGRN